MDRRLPSLPPMLPGHRGLRVRSARGFTLIDAMVVVGIIGVVAAVAVPSTRSMMGGYRLKGDAEAVNNLMSVAKTRAAARFSRARVHVNLAANTFWLETWDKTNSRWTTEGGTHPAATGVRFGFGTLTVPPPNSQAAINQSPACTDDAGAAIANSACITFNSRGMPVDNSLPPAGSVVGNSAIYLTDGSTVYATTITATPLIKLWWSPMRDNEWTRQ